MIDEGWYNYFGNQKRARDRVLHSSPTIVPPPSTPEATLVNTPDRGYEGDLGSDASPLNLVYKRKNMPKAFLTTMAEPTRFCMFNTGYLRKVEFWNFLKTRLAPEILQGVQKVQTVRQPNRNVRMDFWVDAGVARGMKNALYMGSRQRRQGIRKDLRLPLYDLKQYWRPNKEMSWWRLDVYRSWRDRELRYTPPRSVPLRPTSHGFATLNVNGLNGKRSEFIDFLFERRLGFVAVQETLISRDH
jgi:hypothetical protein